MTRLPPGATSTATLCPPTTLIRTLHCRGAWASLAEWQALSKRHESPIFHSTGALYLYPQDGAGIDHSIAIQRGLGIPIEKLTAGAMARRWPQVDFGGIAVGVMQPTMGALMAPRRGVERVGEFVAGGGGRSEERRWGKEG